MPESIDIFKIESNHVLPTRGKILISEPFLCDKLFSRSVILMIDHTCEGSMGLVMNKLSSLSLAEIFEDLDGKENIPIYWGGPLGTDTIFYIHTLTDIPHSLPLGKGLYMNGDFESVKEYIRQGKEIEGRKGIFRLMAYIAGQTGRQVQNMVTLSTKARPELRMKTLEHHYILILAACEPPLLQYATFHKAT